MQEVSTEGKLGEIEDFDIERLKKSLSNPMVDHVRVFDSEKGGQIQIEVNDLKLMITEAVKAALKERDIVRQYEKLMSEGE